MQSPIDGMNADQMSLLMPSFESAAPAPLEAPRLPTPPPVIPKRYKPPQSSPTNDSQTVKSGGLSESPTPEATGGRGGKRKRAVSAKAQEALKTEAIMDRLTAPLDKFGNPIVEPKGEDRPGTPPNKAAKKMAPKKNRQKPVDDEPIFECEYGCGFEHTEYSVVTGHELTCSYAAEKKEQERITWLQNLALDALLERTDKTPSGFIGVYATKKKWLGRIHLPKSCDDEGNEKCQGEKGCVCKRKVKDIGHFHSPIEAARSRIRYLLDQAWSELYHPTFLAEISQEPSGEMAEKNQSVTQTGESRAKRGPKGCISAQNNS